MRTVKRFIAATVAAISVLFCAGCGGEYALGGGLLRAPRSDGTVAEIRAALKRASVTNYTLKTPREGEYRSAYILRDLDGNGDTEGIVFYSVKDGKKEELHFSVVSKSGRRFTVTSDTVLVGSDIESVDFGDLNGDGNTELCIARSIYGAPETRLSVYQISRGIPVEWYDGSYTDYIICDLDDDDREELAVFQLNETENTAVCRLFKESGGKLIETGGIGLDGKISVIKRITETTVDGSPALFVDAYDGATAYFTEIIVCKGGKLSVPLYEQSRQSSLLTSRYLNIVCEDVDGDGNIEIPCMTALPSGTDAQNTLYLTDWKGYSNGKLQSKELSVISKQLQYKFIIDPLWQSKFSIVAAEGDGMNFYAYSTADGFGECLFKIRAAPIGESKKSAGDKAFTVGETEKTVYTAEITEYGKKMNFDEKTITDNFREMGVDKE